jgi:hypothetical protein
MLPLIIAAAAAGAYLIGSSKKDSEVYARGGSMAKGGRTPKYKIGDGISEGTKVKIVSDNENYEDWTDRVLIVTKCSNSGRGYDSGMYPEMLCDLMDVDTGEECPFSLYEYELEKEYADGGMMAKGGQLNVDGEDFSYLLKLSDKELSDRLNQVKKLKRELRSTKSKGGNKNNLKIIKAKLLLDTQEKALLMARDIKKGYDIEPSDYE